MSDVIRSVEDLNVFKKAYSVSLSIHRFSLGLPKYEQYSLGDQIRRASKSICVNLAEGYAKSIGSSKEFKRFILMSLGSSDEMKVWLSYCKDLGYLDGEEWNVYYSSYCEISKMLNGLHSSWK